MSDPLLTADQAAKRLGLDRGVLKAWRARRYGPAWVWTPNGIHYRESSIRPWVVGRR